MISREWLAAQAGELIAAEWQEREAERAQRTAGTQTGAVAGGGGDGADAADGGSDAEAQVRAAVRAHAAEDRRRAAAVNDELAAPKPGGHAKVGYPDAREAERRFWQWFERASKPEEILGRLLVAYAAAAHAREEVVARSHRHGSFRPSAGAAQAFERLCRKHLPAALKRFAAEVEGRKRA